jgi:hypothetical protein
MAAKGDDSKSQALIIALVCFVVLSIGLGVATYYGFAGQDELRKQAQEAKKDKDAQTKRGDWEQLQSLTMKAYVGQTLSKEDQDNLTKLRRDYDSGTLGKDEKNMPEIKSLFDKLTQNMGWDQRKQQPGDSYFHKVESLENEVAQLRGQLAKARDDYDKAGQKMNEELKATQAEKDEMAKALAGSKKELADTLIKKSEAFDKLKTGVEERDDEINTLKKNLDAAGDEKERNGKKWQREKKDLVTQIEKLKEQIPHASVEDFNNPKARIIRLDNRGTTAYIDVGSADNAKPQLTFSVMGVGPAGKATEMRKGAVEITNVLGAHLSAARITDVTDPGRNPVMVGDQLFNAAWTPNARQHVALTGLIDITGDGRDDTAELVRDLERQGIIVDAYLDLKDMTVKGNGLNRQTDFLVVGELPEFEGGSPLKDGDAVTNRKKALLEKASEMRTQASNEGIAIVPLRRFLGMIGYRLPRVNPNAASATLPFLGPSIETKDAAKPEGATKDAAKEKPDKQAPKEREK